ncbi:uncharacterized protein [Musca autumnalis]|uniref:uncharacterized protein n=1 Tax=Musca autumnalis TaxID=221902 RepID=UPI003CECB2EE
MYQTRSKTKSKMENTNQNVSTPVTTTAVTATTLATTTTTASQSTPSATSSADRIAFTTDGLVLNTTASRPATISSGSDFHGFERSQQLTPNASINSPDFMSEAARTVIQDYRQNRQQNESVANSQNETNIAREGLRHIELLKSIETLIPAIVQSTITSLSQQYASENLSTNVWNNRQYVERRTQPNMSYPPNLRNQHNQPAITSNNMNSTNPHRSMNNMNAANFPIYNRVNQPSNNENPTNFMNRNLPNTNFPPPSVNQARYSQANPALNNPNLGICFENQYDYNPYAPSRQNNDLFHEVEQQFRANRTQQNADVSQFRNIQPYQSEHSVENFRRIDKWGLKFDGTSKTPSVEDFVFRVETLRADYNCPWSEVLRNFHHFLSGPALEWLWNYRRMHSYISDWASVKDALVKNFHRFESDFDIQRKILDRRQMNNEPFDEFCNAVLHLRNQQRHPIGEQDLVDIMKSNLKPSMMQLLFAIRPCSLDHFRAEARRAENMLNNQRTVNPKYINKQINELNLVQEEQTEFLDVDAITKERKLICWNCREEGHTFFDCTSEKLRTFCYKCGYDNTVYPKCPSCQGNRNPNVTRSGVENRSRNLTTPNQ